MKIDINDLDKDNEDIDTVEIPVWRHSCGHNEFHISMDSEVYCSNCLEKISFWKVETENNVLIMSEEHGTNH